MLTNLKNQMNMTTTENGAVTYASTMSDCLDLFATIGALRRESETEIVTRFMRAFAENRDLAVKTLFFARDVRGGLGERKVFRVILRWLAHNAPDTVCKNLSYIGEYGRFDDLLVLMDTPLEKTMLGLVREQIRRDIYAMNNGGEVSLLAKWLPSVNISNADAVKTAKNIARFLEMDDRTYRKMLSRLRAHIRIIENNLRERDYTFDYEKQPSKAMFKYRKAFLRNDNERYTDFLGRVRSGDATMHTGTLMPYELVEPYLTPYWGDDHRFLKTMTEGEKQALNTHGMRFPISLRIRMRWLLSIHPVRCIALRSRFLQPWHCRSESILLSVTRVRLQTILLSFRVTLN